MSIKVEVFSSPGCSKCSHARELLKKIVLEKGESCIHWREVNILQELDYAVSLGVLSTPAIAIDGQLVFTRLPSARKLQSALEEHIHKTQDHEKQHRQQGA
ncbi:MAG: thioredoxin family protein [Gammaproteobacteria bacterium]|nr:thioredoxin family protein [Gammaproteobacteria bacterium]